MLLKKFLTIFIIKELLNFKKRKLLSSLRFSTAMTLISASNQILQQRFQFDAFFSGAISSLCLLIADKTSSRLVSTLVFCRTIHFLTRSWVYNIKGEVRNSKIARFIHKFGEFIVWMYASLNTNILISLYPELMPKSYRNGLMTAAGHPVRLGRNYKSILQGMHVLVKGLVGNGGSILNQPFQGPTKSFLKDHINNPLVSGLDELVNVLDDNVQHARLACGAWHPDQGSCVKASIVSVGVLGFKLNIKSYLLLNSFSLISKVYKKKKMEFSQFTKWVMDSVRSCAMVSVYMGLIGLATCVFRRGLKQEYILSYGLAGICGTPAIFIDKPGRLRELNTYCMSNLVSSWVICAFKAGILKYDRTLEMVFITPAFGALAWLIEHRPDTIVGVMKLPFEYILSV